MSYVLALLFGLAIVMVLRQIVDAKARRFVDLAFLAHLVGTLGVIYLNETMSGDMDSYAEVGINMATLVRRDPVRWFPEVVKLLFQQPSALHNFQDTTSAAAGMTSLVFLLVGDSEYAACFMIGFGVLIAQTLLYKAISQHLPREEHALAAISCFLVPSVVFWTSGIIKEAYAMFGVGFLIYGLNHLFTRRSVLAIPLVAIGTIAVAAVKPYILFPLVLSIGLFIARGRKVRLHYLLIGVALGIAGVIALGKMFPHFAVDNLGASIAASRYASERSGGGSFTNTIDEDEIAFQMRDKSLTGQLKYLPLAMVNALFRPIIFEARTSMQLAAALEATFIVVVTLAVIRRTKIRTLVGEVVQSPILLACSTFVLTFGTAVGLSSENLGTLSRYRMPMMPFFFVAILIMRHRFGRKKALVPRPQPRSPLALARARRLALSAQKPTSAR